MDLRGKNCLRYGNLFEDWEIRIARRLIGEFQREWLCLRLEPFDDLLQECLIHWHSKKNKYDPAKGGNFRTFMSRVVRNKLMNMVEMLEADKRKINRLVVSLDDPIDENENSETWQDKIDEGSEENYNHEACDQSNMKIDLVKVLKRLSPREQRLCQLLNDGLNVAEASKLLKISRSTAHDEIRRIRELFENEGLRVYLK
jgi:RNA polymerase sigma factor (sigma-70 family)